MQIEDVDGEIDSQDEYKQLIVLIKNKQYQQASHLIKQKEKNRKLLSLLVHYFQSLEDQSEDYYQNWLYIFACSVHQNNCDSKFIPFYSQIINKFIELTSPKFSLLIIKSTLHRLAENTFGRFILGSFFHLFYSLVSDPTVGDLVEMYKQFTKSYLECKQTHSSIQNDNRSIYCKSLMRFLGSIIKLQIKINRKFILSAIDLCVLVLKDIAKQLKDDGIQSQQGIQQLDKRTYLIQIPLKLIGKLKIDILQRPYIILTNSYLLEQAQQANQFVSQFYQKKLILLLVIKTLNNQLQVDLSKPTKFASIQEQFLTKAIYFICQQFQNKDSQTLELVIAHYAQIQQLVQKLHIFVGSISPKDQLYKRILKVFANPLFLSIEAKQRLYSKLITKHTNYSFKIHLITQYRHLLTPSCSRTVWMRSTTLLLKELKQLQPNTSIDYIGHIISLAFFWKQVLKKFCQSKNFLKQCYLNISQVRKQFEQNLKKLKQGLQVKVQMAHNENSQLQRNETNLCIFRISQMIE